MRTCPRKWRFVTQLGFLTLSATIIYQHLQYLLTLIIIKCKRHVSSFSYHVVEKKKGAQKMKICKENTIQGRVLSQVLFDYSFISSIWLQKYGQWKSLNWRCATSAFFSKHWAAQKHPSTHSITSRTAGIVRVSFLIITNKTDPTSNLV